MESKKRKTRRRRASSDFTNDNVTTPGKKNAGVNTTEFPIEEPKPKSGNNKESEILESQALVKDEENANDRKSLDYPNIDEEFEDLPGISDSSEEDDEKGKENSIPPQSILKRSQSEGRHKGRRRVVMRVKREPEIGLDGGDIDIFEDDWEELGESDQNIGTDAARRYIHEKAIFQELTHLKRMQIQYGKVQERILVRSLVGNFCKMHGLDPARFKFQTFYSWEKFLYDALSDQLKIIYMEERERLTQARLSRPTLDRFENRLRQARAVPLNDRISNMSHVYATSSQTTGKSTEKRKNEKFICGQGGKRCDCLGKHLFVKQK
uniref:Uncharacterized protein n=1 Tax=Heterorhabditis bacteriophora TaxID=37862 RepID=A0A1I7XI79_HETBA